MPLCPYDACTDFDCTNLADGYYADPADCSWYYYCMSEHPLLHIGCLGGMHFNESVGECDWPSNVQCADD